MTEPRPPLTAEEWIGMARAVFLPSPLHQTAPAVAHRKPKGDPSMSLSVKQIARVAHEVNRKIQEAIGEAVSPAWDDAPDWQRDSSVDGVEAVLQNPNAPASASHENWLRHKEETGWKHGDVKDEEAKTHPLMVPYEDLPVEHQIKDHVFRGVVLALSALPAEELAEAGYVEVAAEPGAIPPRRMGRDVGAVLGAATQPDSPLAGVTAVPVGRRSGTGEVEGVVNAEPLGRVKVNDDGTTETEEDGRDRVAPPRAERAGEATEKAFGTSGALADDAGADDAGDEAATPADEEE